MKINKKAVALLSVGMLIGTAGVVGMQVHAQQNTTSPAVVQTQTPSTTANTTNAQDTNSQDTDNVQDPGGIEKPDTAETVNGVETNDQQGSDKDTTPDSGKEDPNEAVSAPTVVK
jgi:uncharacterized protein HemX